MIRKFLGMALTGCSALWAQSAVLGESGGWLESAYVEWQPVSGAEKYNVYVTGGGLSNQKLDDALIRSYGTYVRADALGLAAGQYTLKVVPVISGSEKTAATTGYLTVKAHDRSGFAFMNGRVPGGYQASGTPKSGAIILYVTEANKNTISLDVTGASSNPCVGLQAILDGFKKGNDTRPLIIRLVGQIKDPAYLLAGDAVIENAENASSYITLEGVGEDATVDGWGIRIKNAANVEVRNIGIMNVDSDEGDNIGLQQSNTYVWVHNVDFFYGQAGSDPDQIKGDGSLDCKKSTYVTFSYNHFWDNGKVNLLGLSEGTTVKRYITYHHNWYDHSDSRHPRVRYFSAHVYNNYYDGNSKYGAGSTLASSVFMEANYFRKAKYPMLISMQGSDVWSESKQANDYTNMPTFSSENGGMIKAFNNYMEGQTRFVAYGASGYVNSTVDFDAYVVANRSDAVPATVKSAYGANTYDNFDINASLMYSYTPDSPADARTKVMAYAGRINGGDFRWTFDNAVDDEAYLVNTPLKNALMSYQTSLVSVQSEGGVVIVSSSSAVPVSSSSSTPTSSSSIASSSSQSASSSSSLSSSSAASSSSSQVVSSSSQASSSSVATGDRQVIAQNVIHNFTESGSTSQYFTITGNLSTAKGTVVYQGAELTQCLKMESATSIAFETAADATLVLVFNSEFGGGVLVDGVSYTATAGIVQFNLSAGSHTIAKEASANLYYIGVDFANAPVIEPPTASLIKEMQRSMVFDSRTLQLWIPASLENARWEARALNGELAVRGTCQNASCDLSVLRAGVYGVVLKTATKSGASTSIRIP